MQVFVNSNSSSLFSKSENKEYPLLNSTDLIKLIQGQSTPKQIVLDQHNQHGSFKLKSSHLRTNSQGATYL